MADDEDDGSTRLADVSQMRCSRGAAARGGCVELLSRTLDRIRSAAKANPAQRGVKHRRQVT